MKWVGNPETDLILSLMDDSQTAILGQVSKDGEGLGWNAFDYCANNGQGKRVGLFQSVKVAKERVESSVKGRNL